MSCYDDLYRQKLTAADKAGYFTFGAVNDYTSSAACHCRHLIVEQTTNTFMRFDDD